MKAKWVPDAQNKHGVLNIDLICLNQSQIQSSRVSGFDRRTRPQTLTHACWHRWRTGMKSSNSLFVFSVHLRSSDRPFIFPAYFFIFHKRADFRRSHDWRRCADAAVNSLSETTCDSIRNPEDLQVEFFWFVRLLHITLLRLKSDSHFDEPISILRSQESTSADLSWCVNKP